MPDVKTSAFMLSSATLMMAPAFTTDVFSLTPLLHSVGLTNEVSVDMASTLLELKSGVAQVSVDAKRTGVDVSIKANIWEFTAANIARSIALAGGGQISAKRGVITGAVASGAVTLSINPDTVPGDATSAITAVTDIPAGSTILIQRVNGQQDYVFPTISSGVATGTGPYAIPIAAPYAIPTGMSFAVGDRVWILSPMPIGSMDQDDLFGVKITGTLSSNDRPVTYIAPKVRISKGFQLHFTETAYGSMPFEMQPFIMSAGEATGRLLEIGTRSSGRLYVGA